MISIITADGDERELTVRYSAIVKPMSDVESDFEIILQQAISNAIDNMILEQTNGGESDKQNADETE